jgi:uncharacterized protein YecE (DUF72 family)
MIAAARIGCSGWTYDDWRGPTLLPPAESRDHSLS